jgi:2'-5' RNA ligase
MRAFVGVMLPDQIRGRLESQVEALRPHAVDLRWEQPDRWHVTLTFLGDVQPAVIEDLTPRLTRAVTRTPVFDVQLAGVGRFGRRILFAKIGGDRAGLRRLADRCNAAARRAGVALDEERFRPHVTLGRSRQGMDLRPVVAAGADLDGGVWPVEQAQLVESVLSRPPLYRVLQSFPLGDAV